MSLIRASACLVVVLVGLATVPPAVADLGHEACLKAIADEERRRSDLPKGLLHAIGLVESGYRPAGSKRTVPWPWAVNSPAGSFYLASRREAVAKVEDLRRQGIANIDVGCMQVNLHHHPQAFSSLEAAFDPKANVQYAARFLTELERQAPSLFTAVGRYHSHTPERGEAYAERVFARWGKAPTPVATSRHGLGAPASPLLIDGPTGARASGEAVSSVSPTSFRPLAPRGATTTRGTRTTLSSLGR